MRILKSQAEALKKEGASASALIRVLLHLYFEGRIPEARLLLPAEKHRAEEALRKSQFGQSTREA
jgi:hypothetical protein